MTCAVYTRLHKVCIHVSQDKQSITTKLIAERHKQERESGNWGRDLGQGGRGERGRGESTRYWLGRHFQNANRKEEKGIRLRKRAGEKEAAGEP